MHTKSPVTDNDALVTLIHCVLDATSSSDHDSSDTRLSRVLGVLEGIASDGVFSKQEAIDLEDLMEELDIQAECWPGSALRQLLQDFGDGAIGSAQALARLDKLKGEIAARSLP